MSSDLENQVPQDHTLLVENKDEGTSSGLDPNHPDHPVTKVVTEGDYVTFGNEKYLRSELVEAFGGSFNPGLSPPPKHNMGNPGPLGLSAFALTTFVLSLINCEARGVTIPNVVVGLAYFYGGFAQLIAGMFEIAVGNTFGGVALSSYGGFWGSWAAIYTPSFGILDAYAESTGKDLPYAVGLYCVAWFIFTFFLMLMTLKSTVAFFGIFFFLSITFLLLAIANFTGKVAVQKAAGVFGLITAFFAWYNAYAGIANEQNSYITVKAIHLPDLQDRRK
ncbi:accumulation of dyads [Scheffersomyces amazonensis]|uniref:accumulation of dyads n=1 Tax=Scheffersomyces amazonensis TaxID=1078765 RepID=UPI00315D8FE7